MRLRLCVPVLLLLPLSAQAARDPAEDAYQDARRSYYALKGDPAHRKLRHSWLRVSSKFEAVATRHPRSARAPDALFTAAELMEELSRISRMDEDLQSAVTDYERLCSGHPKHRL